MEGKRLYFRISIMGLMIIAFIFISGGRLYNMQVVHGDQYLKQSERRITRSHTVRASRGEILDRYGRPLVVNRLSYSITLNASIMKKSGINDLIANLIEVCKKNGQEYSDTLPVTMQEPYRFLEGASSQQIKRYERYLKKKSLEGKNPAEVMEYLYDLYEIDPAQDAERQRMIAGVRYEIELRELFYNIPAYTFAEDVDIKLVSIIREQEFPGVNIDCVPIREYKTQYAAHILGRTGPIFEEEYEQLKEKGYAMDAIVGKDGVEKAFEDWLRGIDGVETVETNTQGKVTNIIDTVLPTPGKNCMLTIDLKLQETAERSLAETIPRLIAEGNERWGGFDAKGGAVAVIEVNTGDILALASYPSFPLESFSSDYARLSEDPLKPMYNRATQGIYAPGSTFKMCTSIAALETGAVKPSTRILDRGIYTYYAPSYTPMCALYRSSRQTHGNIDIVDALRVSCNYFFYEIGRLTGIESIREYARRLGLGSLTGIEISESAGILAGPEFSEKAGVQWYPGNTLAAAIGQSDNAFTPLQLANYVATLANGGTRYRTHLLKSAKSYDYSETLAEIKPEVVDYLEVSGQSLNAVLSGMRAVAETGTAANVFGDYPVKVGAKTGSAQITATKSDNGIFVAFAPFDDPEIAVAVVVEHGGQGNRVAPIARDIFDAYFGQGEAMDSVENENTLRR